MRRTDRWKRFWNVWTATFALSGVILDTLATIFGGYDATLTCNIRRWTQLEPKGRFERLGRAGLVSFFLWCILHLGWGIANPIPRSYSPMYKRGDDRD